MNIFFVLTILSLVVILMMGGNGGGILNTITVEEPQLCLSTTEMNAYEKVTITLEGATSPVVWKISPINHGCFYSDTDSRTTTFKAWKEGPATIIAVSDGKEYSQDIWVNPGESKGPDSLSFLRKT